MKNKIILLTLLFGAVSLTSCLKEHGRDKCPSNYSVVIEIKDKNYSNIADIPGMTPQDEHLPFSQYISNLSYHLTNLNSGQVTIKAPAQVTELTQESISLFFQNLEDGNYSLRVFGNTDRAPELRDGLSVYQLHPAKQESTDIYIAEANLNFSPEAATQHVQLQRAKGYLSIQFEGLPDTVGMIGLRMGPVYGEIDQHLNYNTETEIEKKFTNLQYPSTTLTLHGAPTPTGKNSTLRLALYRTAQDTEPFAYLPDIALNMARNKITALQIDYKPEGGIEIWIYTEGGWIKLHELDLQ